MKAGKYRYLPVDCAIVADETIAYYIIVSAKEVQMLTGVKLERLSRVMRQIPVPAIEGTSIREIMCTQLEVESHTTIGDERSGISDKLGAVNKENVRSLRCACNLIICTMKVKLLTDTSNVGMERNIRSRIIDFICSAKDNPHLKYRALALLTCIEDCRRILNDGGWEQ